MGWQSSMPIQLEGLSIYGTAKQLGKGDVNAKQMLTHQSAFPAPTSKLCRPHPIPLLQIDGVSFIARTIAARQVAVVLDLDATLLESEHLPVEPAEW